MDKPKVIVICGPTASGKTALSIELAKKIDGEIISCDSMQIYKDMNIGTAKVTKSEMQGIKHYLVDFVSPDTRYSVADYKTDAEKAIENIISKGKIPIIVGGTGLYVDSLIYGIEYPEIKFDEEYRKKLEKEAEEGLENLYNKAKEIDEQAMQKISINDRKRIISIDREKLYERINIRVDKMIENGLIEEVENLQRKYNHFPTAMQGLGYKEVVQYFQKELTKEEMIEKIKQESRRYAKRQLTWFRKNKQTIWIDGLANLEDNINIIEKELNK